MNYFLGIDIAKTNHVASLIDNKGDVVIRAIKFTNSNEGLSKLLSTLQDKLECGLDTINQTKKKRTDIIERRENNWKNFWRL